MKVCGPWRQHPPGREAPLPARHCQIPGRPPAPVSDPCTRCGTPVSATAPAAEERTRFSIRVAPDAPAKDQRTRWSTCAGTERCGIVRVRPCRPPSGLTLSVSTARRHRYRAGHQDYQDSYLPTGDTAGTAEDALATVCGLYPADPTASIQTPDELTKLPTLVTCTAFRRTEFTRTAFRPRAAAAPDSRPVQRCAGRRKRPTSAGCRPGSLTA